MKEDDIIKNLRAELHRETWLEQNGANLLLAAVVIVVMFAALFLLSGCAPVEVPGTATSTPPPEPTQTAKVVKAVEKAVTRPTPTKEVCIVETGYEKGTVNVRSGPGMNYPVIDVVSQAEQMIMTGPVQNGWRKVTTARLVDGWFYTDRWCKHE